MTRYYVLEDRNEELVSLGCFETFSEAQTRLKLEQAARANARILADLWIEEMEI